MWIPSKIKKLIHREYTHLELHREFQLAIHDGLNAIIENVESLSNNVSVAQKLLSNPEVWHHALVSGYCHLAEDWIRVRLCDTSPDTLITTLLDGTLDPNELEFSQITGEFYAKLVTSDLTEEGLQANKNYYEAIPRCVNLAQTYLAGDTKPIDHKDKALLLQSLSFCLFFHPHFYEESERETIIAWLADQVAEDVLGPWPE